MVIRLRGMPERAVAARLGSAAAVPGYFLWLEKEAGDVPL